MNYLFCIILVQCFCSYWYRNLIVLRKFDGTMLVQCVFPLWYRNVTIPGKFSQKTSVLSGNSMGEDLLSLFFQSFMLYLARLVCLASYQSLTKFWLTLPTAAGVPDFV